MCKNVCVRMQCKNVCNQRYGYFLNRIKLQHSDEIENETTKISSWRNRTLGQKSNLGRHHKVT